MIAKIQMQINLLIVFLLTTLTVGAQVTSSFDSNDEGWRVTGDAVSALPQYRSTGGNPGGYISSVDLVTGSTWYWSAPSKFLGNHLSAFGKNLEFDLRQSSLNNQFNNDDVIIIGSGITLTIDLANNPLTIWTHYSVPLSTTVAWRRSTLAGPLATETEIKTVLSNITTLRIRGEYISGNDVGDLDNVILPSTAAPLPLTLVSFTAGVQNNNALLQWTTSSESNTSHFEVEHSTDGRYFQTAGSVSAAINSTTKKSYVFWHWKTVNGNNFYRLKMIDRSNTYNYSPVIKLMLSQRMKLEAFPNPTAGVFTLSGLLGNGRERLQVLDLTGKVLMEQMIDANTATVDISQLPKGVYILRIVSNKQLQHLNISKQ